MNNPAASCRVSNIKQLELPEVCFWLPLALNILFYIIPIGKLTNCSHIVVISPKLSFPKLFLYQRLSSKYLSRSNAFENLNNCAQSYFWMSTTKQVNMIFITTYGFHLDSVSFLYACGSFYNNFLRFFIKKSLPVLNRKYNMIVCLPCTPIAFFNFSLYHELCVAQSHPRSKLPGITN
jgi:hypothetical protein